MISYFIDRIHVHDIVTRTYLSILNWKNHLLNKMTKRNSVDLLLLEKQKSNSDDRIIFLKCADTFDRFQTK